MILVLAVPEKNSKPVMVALYKVAVALIRNEQGEYLITQRHPERTHGGCWEFPGGKIEEGESPEAALIREIKEEININLRSFSLWDRVKHEYPDKRVELYIFHTQDFDGEPECLEDQQALSWRKPEDMLALKFPEANYDIIEQLRS